MTGVVVVADLAVGRAELPNTRLRPGRLLNVSFEFGRRRVVTAHICIQRLPIPPKLLILPTPRRSADRRRALRNRHSPHSLEPHPHHRPHDELVEADVIEQVAVGAEADVDAGPAVEVFGGEQHAGVGVLHLRRADLADDRLARGGVDPEIRVGEHGPVAGVDGAGAQRQRVPGGDGNGVGKAEVDGRVGDVVRALGEEGVEGRVGAGGARCRCSGRWTAPPA